MCVLNVGFIYVLVIYCYVFYVKLKSFGVEIRSVFVEVGGNVLRVRYGEKWIKRVVIFLNFYLFFKCLWVYVGEYYGVEVLEKGFIKFLFVLKNINLLESFDLLKSINLLESFGLLDFF